MMKVMPTIYRQYRPQRFADVSGQPHVTDVLQQAVTQDKISHAYLFQGPRGTGKTSTARIFAKRINCAKAKGSEACGKCDSCVAIQEGKHMDVIEIDAASNRGIDNIRELREQSSLMPTMSKYKVYIIDEVHMLSHDAFPALLKTLEEPVPHVVFILATTELHKVPQTILSRCQVFRFRRATETEMRTRLQHILKEEKRETDETVLDFIISRSDGCYRDAESLLGQLLVMDDKKIALEGLTQWLGLPSPTLVQDFLAALVEQKLSTAVQLLDGAYAQGFDPEQFVTESIRTARDVLVSIAKGEAKSPLATLPQAQARMTAIIRALVQAAADLAYVPQPLIAVQLAILTVCQSSATQSVTMAPKIAAPAFTPQPTLQPIAKPVSTGVNITASLPQAKPKEVAQPKVETTPTGVVSAATVKGLWDKLIAATKQNNPVASTFLRAVEPIEVEGTEIILRVSYPLHRTFFEKPDNKALVEKELSALLDGKEVKIKCRMDGDAIAPLIKKQAGQEAPDTGLYDAVKEVFGTA